MTALLRLIILVPLAWVAALVAGAIVVTIGLFGGEVDGDAAPYAVGAAIGFIFTAGAISFLPSLVAILLAEFFRWRSVFFYLAAGGLIGLIGRGIADVGDGLDFTGNLLVICLAGGFVGGFVYWLIAGRDAGLVDPTSPA